MKRLLVVGAALAMLLGYAQAQTTYNADSYHLSSSGGNFTNGNGDSASFTTVNSEINSWWGLGIKSSCCNNYSGYGIVFDARSGSMFTQGKIGIGTGSPLGRIHVASKGSDNTGLVIGDAGDSTGGTSRIDFLGWRDVQSNYLGASIFADRKYVCCGGYPSGGYAGVILTDLVFATRSDVGANSGVSDVVERMRITSGGELQLKSNVKLAAGSGASVTFPDNSVQSTAWNGTTCGGDYAESVDVIGDRKSYEPGDVLVIDAKVEGSFVKSSEPYSTAVMGIYSTKPGLTGRRQLTAKSDDEIPMAMIGIVPTKVTTENGPIRPGDLLVTSSIPGYAMKGTDRSKMMGAVIGKAMGHLDAGKGVIEAGVTLQ